MDLVRTNNGFLLRIVERSDWHRPHSFSKKSDMGHVFSTSAEPVRLSLTALDVENSDNFHRIVRGNGGNVVGVTSAARWWKGDPKDETKYLESMAGAHQKDRKYCQTWVNYK